MPKVTLLITTTVPETLATILKHQPKFLGSYFNVALATSSGNHLDKVALQEDIVPETVDMSRGISPFKDLVSIYKMVKLIKRIKPTIVHSYTPKAGLITMIAAWLCRTPRRIHTFTGLIFPTSTGIKKNILITVDRLICACATTVVPEGDGVRKDLIAYSVTKKSLAIIGHGNIAGIDTKFLSPTAPEVSSAAEALRSALKITNDDFVYCFVGRLNRDKGITELVESFISLPNQARLLIVGELDETAPIPPEILELLRTHPRIHLLGFLADIRPPLSCSDVFVLPSYREGFPNSILEANAMALPAIASNISGCNEIIHPGWNGWLVTPRNSAELKKVMQAALALDASARRTMGLHARQRVQERFERTEHWKRMVAFYCQQAQEC